MSAVAVEVLQREDAFVNLRDGVAEAGLQEDQTVQITDRRSPADLALDLLRTILEQLAPAKRRSVDTDDCSCGLNRAPRYGSVRRGSVAVPKAGPDGPDLL